MAKPPTTYAFIDGQNLNKAIKNDIKTPSGKLLYRGKKIDYKKLRDYLWQKYGVQKAYIFLGYLEANKGLYKYFEHCGFEIIFKKTTIMNIKSKEIIKGNVDIDIAVYSAARLFSEYQRAIFISGDGDFLELYDFISERGKLERIIIPNQWAYSKLLRIYKDKIDFLNATPNIFESTKKTGGSGRSKSLGMSGRGLFRGPRDDTPSIPNHHQKVNRKGSK